MTLSIASSITPAPFTVSRPKLLPRVTHKRRVPCEASVRKDSQDSKPPSWKAGLASAAAAALLLAQTQPALAESQLESSLRREQEFESLLKGKGSSLESFFKKAPQAAKENIQQAAKALAGKTPDAPFSKPVETAVSAIKSTAEEAKNAASREAEVVAKGEEEPKSSGGLISNLFGDAPSVPDAAKSAAETAQNTASSVTGAADNGAEHLKPSGDFLSNMVGSAPTDRPQLAPPQPAEVQEELPESAPNQPNKLPEQPKPEPPSNQLPEDSAGGKTSDTQSGGGFLDFFGGSDSGSAGKKASKNVQEASQLPSSPFTEQVASAGDVASTAKSKVNDVAEAAASEVKEVATKDGGTATLIGVGASATLAVVLFTLQGNAAEESSKH